VLVRDGVPTPPYGHPSKEGIFRRIRVYKRSIKI
jgi:hypothetical protein